MPRKTFWPLVLLFAAIGCGRIIATYKVFSQFYDEPFHVACGMEWLEKGTYLYERQHPPLSRIAVALPLYLQGLRGQMPGNLADLQKSITANANALTELGSLAIMDGNAILNSGDYTKNLAWARAGNLPFFILSTVLLAAWGEMLFGSWIGLIAAGLFTMLPAILGNAGVATTDMAPVAGLLAVLYSVSVWIERPAARESTVLGLVAGLALVTKFSLLPFLGAGFLLTMAWVLLRRPAMAEWRRIPFSRHALHLVWIGGLMFLCIWATYRFTLAPVVTGHGYTPQISGLGHFLGGITGRLLVAKIPLGEFLGGIGSVALHNKGGHASFLLGSFRTTGWWYFFPVVLAVKTPICFLLLAIAGVPLMARKMSSVGQHLPMLFAGGILASCMVSRIDIGVRHILPLYPLLALFAAFAAVWLFERWRWAAAVAGVLLLLESAQAHPDYSAFFNLLAASHPERILVNSDLDGGQDLARLVHRTRELGVERLQLAYFGSADLKRAGLPAYEELSRRERVTGWIAVSAFNLELECAANGNYCWLQRETPMERVGRSIFLYQLKTH